MQFFIPLIDFSNNCTSIYPRANSFTWGFLTLPIKLRFGNKAAPFTFEEKVNFAISLGWKWQQPSTTYIANNLLAGISIGGGVRADNKDGTSSSPAAITASIGYMYQYDKFQVGIFTGLDFLSQTTNINWQYQGKPWLGFAIGFSLFGENQTQANKTQTQGE